MSELLIVTFFAVGVMMLIIICSSCSCGSSYFYDKRFRARTLSEYSNWNISRQNALNMKFVPEYNRKTPI